MNNYDLSICVTTYNHENYIKKALDSVFEQKTDYSFEVLVGEDYSTDKTREILKQYEIEHKNYVNNGQLKIFYRSHNMNNESPNNAEDLKRYCKGRYVITLEGDDFWTDDRKIDKQINFLENHQEYIAVSHNCVVVGEDGIANGETYPECKQTEYTIKHYMSDVLPGQTATLMYRNIYNNSKIDTSILKKELTPSDRLIVLVLLCNGRIYCLQECMSAYRHVTTHGDSFSANYKYNFKRSANWYKEFVTYLSIAKPEMLKYGEALYFRNIIRDEECTTKEIKYFMSFKHKFYSLWKWFIFKIRKDILHKEIWI
jgi:glycosyltransferase involved in cell wall biosynthesis